MLCNSLDCLDFPHTYFPKTLGSFSEQLLEEQLFTTASGTCCCNTFCVNRVLQILNPNNPKVFLTGSYFPSIQSLV